jgi:hypothetical protein
LKGSYTFICYHYLIGSERHSLLFLVYSVVYRTVWHRFVRNLPIIGKSIVSKPSAKRRRRHASKPTTNGGNDASAAPNNEAAAAAAAHDNDASLLANAGSAHTLLSPRAGLSDHTLAGRSPRATHVEQPSRMTNHNEQHHHGIDADRDDDDNGEWNNDNELTALKRELQRLRSKNEMLADQLHARNVQLSRLVVERRALSLPASPVASSLPGQPLHVPMTPPAHHTFGK